MICEISSGRSCIRPSMVSPRSSWSEMMPFPPWGKGRITYPSRRRQPVVLEDLAQAGLEDLAGGGMGDRVDEGAVAAHPPLGDLVLEEVDQLVLAHLGAGLLPDDQQRPLVPLGVVDADHRRLGH